jgi:hypothetical protein
MYERYKKNLEIKTIMDFCFDLALFCFWTNAGSILLKYEDSNDYEIFWARIVYVNNRLLL